ncbi:MAG: hypothetical protein IJF78_04935 [Clostridia bacterium]|nr:hypothetical protein [Clostridia bacterium]
MDRITVNFSEITGTIKPMHAINNGPLKKRDDQTRHNFDTYKAAGIPFARNHDAAFCDAYGGEHSVDVHNIFPDFDADPDDPASYDFVLTDEYIERTMAAGAETYYRLGAKIEHNIKKYGTLPPKDYHKWAVICEHIIRHMNEGWADGHHYGITYWEIWNEPDLDPDDSPNKRCWGGMEAEFFEFFAEAACHLKSCFPDLKIGGPALAHRMDWAERFLIYMSEHKVPLDFFSWHIYTTSPDAMVNKCSAVQALMDKYGYTDAENILNEWNYIRNWGDAFIYSVKTIINMKGAAFIAGCMLGCQNSPLDMLMYYDAQPSCFCGLWDYYTMEPIKGYYPFPMFDCLYRLGNAAAVDNPVPGVKAVAASGENGGAIMLVYYNDDDGCTDTREFDLPLIGTDAETAVVSLLYEEHDCTETTVTVTDGAVHLVMKKNSVVLVKV